MEQNASSRYATVIEALVGAARHLPENGFPFQEMRGTETKLTYVQLEAETARRAAGLQALGLGQGERLGLIVIEPREFILSFLAAVRVGAVPVPLYPPMSLGELDAYVERTAGMLRAASVRLLFISAELQSVLWSLTAVAPGLERLITEASLPAQPPPLRVPVISPEDTLFLQFTSGSTREPRGVVVSHANVTANVYAGIAIYGFQSTDICVSWLPLYHDLGLIGPVLAFIYRGASSVYLPTLRFLRRPSEWLEAAHRHRATISAAPCFALGLAVRKARPEELERWDLSRLRMINCGAEPILPETVRAFTELFHERCGLPRHGVSPAYGLAESTLGVSSTPRGEPMRTRRVDAALFRESGRAVLSEGGVEHVSCGVLVEGTEARIVGEDAQSLPDEQEGELWLRGPSITRGYLDAAEANRQLFHQGWLRTGDLGYFSGGHLYVTGRLKDLLIINGRKYHPQALEWDVARVEGVRRGNVVAFSRPGAHTEEVVVVLETQMAETQALVASVRSVVHEAHGLTVADVVCLSPGHLPKTSSGKLQRRQTRERYLSGRLLTHGSRGSGASTGNKLSVARHMARSLWMRARHSLRSRPRGPGSPGGQ